jgi:tellurite resistance protein
MSDLENFASRHELDVAHVRRWVLEAMVLGAISDGEFDRRESDEIVRAIGKNAAFVGMDADELRGHLERAFEGIASDGFPARVHALAGALPTYANRVLAFRCATKVAFANGQLANQEIAFLRELQRTLGITEGDVTRAFDAAQDADGMNVVPPSIDPVEAYLDTLLMAAAADRELRDEELATLIAFVIERDEFDGIGEDALREYIYGRLQEFSSGGTPKRLDALTDELPGVEERENAYGLAVSMALSDGELAEEERVFLVALRNALDLDDDQVERLHRRVAAG